MIVSGRASRQPKRTPWTLERFLRERAVAMGSDLDTSTFLNYSSALNSYLEFINLHNLDVKPTEDTLSFYIVYMCHHIRADSVRTYLSGICKNLEPFFPHVRTVRKSMIVSRTMQGCMRLYGQPSRRKSPLSLDNIHVLTSAAFLPNASHNDLLFGAMVVTGFNALLRLGEMVRPDADACLSWKKITKRSTTHISNSSYSFWLPAHKADPYFEGNKVVINASADGKRPWRLFRLYLASRDQRFPLASPLWLNDQGQIPKRGFFINRLRQHLSKDYAGQSMRAGGATALADAGVPADIIKRLGRWSSDAWERYIRKNPALMSAFLAVEAGSALH